MFKDQNAQLSLANPVSMGSNGDFSLAGVTAGDSLGVIEKKMRSYKLNQYAASSQSQSLSHQFARCAQSFYPNLFGQTAHA